MLCKRNKEMASITQIPYLVKPMFEPEHMEFAQVLQDGLRRHFKVATVEWVDCPDLTKEPFSLAAPGLCGDAVLLEIGRTSDLYCQLQQSQKKYHFKEILREIYNNRNSLVIGASYGLHSSTQQLGELIMNASFFYQVANNDLVVNESRLGYWNYLTRKYMYEPIYDVNPVCYVHGNFFISRGKPGKVLRVYAKRSRTRLQFPVALHEALDQKCCFINSFSFFDIIGLGGIFLTKYGEASYDAMHSCIDQLKTSENINYWLYRDNSNLSARAVGTIVINNNNYNNHLSLSGQKKYGLTEFHFKSFSLDKNLNAHVMESGDKSEYLGYFYPAKFFYHLDP